MKNLKKVLALVVVFAMMVSSVAFAAIYPDVAADANYANAVSVLSDLGMIKGDDKGNFNPDATITRAEFATMITRLLGVESAATGKANFDDVAADHWATGYIAMAQQQGIISGYGDGKFGPENPVKYEEAVKMLVCALGYEQMAVAKGGWVAGYLTTAYQIGLLDGATGTQGAGAPRSLVAQLCYNALDIPMMEQTGFGTEVKYEVMEKNANHDKVTLLTKMGIYKLGGMIGANTKVTFKANNTLPATGLGQTAFEYANPVAETDKGLVNFWWSDDYDSPVKAWNNAVTGGAKHDSYRTATSYVVTPATTEDTNGNSILDTEDANGNGSLDAGEDTNSNGRLDTEDANGNGVIDVITPAVYGWNWSQYVAGGVYYGAEILEVGETDIENAIGNALVVYLKKNVNRYEVLAYEIDAASTSLVIKEDQIDTNNATTGEIRYYEDVETSTKSKKISISLSADVIENNAVSSLYNVQTSLNPGSILEFVDTNNDNRYDVIKVTAYQYVIVDEVNVAKGHVEGKNAERINFAIDDPDAKVSITDVNGNAVELKDIAEGDVLAYVVKLGTGSLRAGTYDALDVIVLKDSFVTGAATGYSAADSKVWVADKELDIAGTGYDLTKINAKAEGKFWLALDGETVIGFEGDVAKSGDYAYIAGAYYATNKDTADKIVTLEVITKDGYGEYKIAKSVDLIDQNGNEFDVDADESMTAAGATVAWTGINTGADLGDALLALLAETTEDANGNGTLDAGEDANSNGVIDVTSPAATSTDVAKRTVKMSFNSNKEIISITPAAASADEEKMFAYDDTTTKIFNADNVKLGTKAFKDGAVVLDLDFTDIEKSKFTDVGYFTDDNNYAALMFDVDANNMFAFAAVYYSDAVYSDGDSIAIVKSVSTALNADGDNVTKVVVIKDCAEVTLTFDNNGHGYSKGYGSTASVGALTKGDVIMYTANSEGLVDKYDVVGQTTLNANGTKTFAFDGGLKGALEDGVATNGEADYDDGDAFFYGYIVDNKASNRLAIKVASSISDGGHTADEGTINNILNVLDLSTKGANMYGITGNNADTARIVVDDYRVGNVDSMYLVDADPDNDTNAVTGVDPDGDTDDQYEVYYVIVRTFEGAIVDVISLDAPTGRATVVVPFDGTPLTAPVVTPVAPVAPVVEEKAEVKEEIVELEGFDL